MTTIRNLLLGGVMAAFCCSIGNAQVSYSNSLYGATLIYSNYFGGAAVDINATAPTYINPSASSFGGTTSALFDVVTNSFTDNYYAYQDGTLGSKQESVLLPFTPVSGYVYTLSASLTFATQPPGSGWGALGWGANFPPSNGSAGDPRFNQALVNGNPWALLNYAAQGGGAQLWWKPASGLVGGTPNLMTSLNTPYTIKFVVDTTGTRWTTALYVADTWVGATNYVYTANPTIRSIGYGQTATTAGAYKWNSLTLSASPLVITKEPVSATVAAGTAFTNTVVVAAVAPSYQWFTNNVPIAGATNASLIFNPVTAADACTNYYAVITNGLGGAATSAPVSLVISSGPVEFGFVPPLPPTNVIFLAGTTLTIPATVSSDPPVGYYWTNLTTGVLMGSGGRTVPGNLDATLTIPNAPVSLSGDVLELVVTNATDSTNWFTTLFSPEPPVTLDYSSPILYSNCFNGGTWSISGMPVTAANSLVGGTSTTWTDALGTNDTGSMQASGVDACPLGNSWLLPFNPHSGCVYTVTASLTFSGNPGSWVGLGFAQRVVTNAAVGYGRFSDGGTTPPSQGPNGYNWMILSEGNGNVQCFMGPAGSGQVISQNGFFTAGPGTHTAKVVLDTTGPLWSVAFYVDDVLATTSTYAVNPPIGAVGITQTTLSAPGYVRWNYFALTVTNSINPEPTNLVFSVTGGQLTLSWPQDHIGWQLQSNSVAVTDAGAWFTVAGSTTTNQITITPDASQTNVFYRMFLQRP